MPATRPGLGTLKATSPAREIRKYHYSHNTFADICYMYTQAHNTHNTADVDYLRNPSTEDQKYKGNPYATPHEYTYHQHTRTDAHAHICPSDSFLFCFLPHSEFVLDYDVDDSRLIIYKRKPL